MSKYKKLLNKVVAKIDRWHVKQQERRRGRFERDEDFIESSPSPSRFSSDDEEELRTKAQSTKSGGPRSQDFNIHQSRISGSDHHTQPESPQIRRKDLVSVDLSPVHPIKEERSQKQLRVKRRRSRTTLMKPMTNNLSNSNSGSNDRPTKKRVIMMDPGSDQNAKPKPR